MARPIRPLYPGCPTTAIEAARIGVPLRPTTWTAWDAAIAMAGALIIGTVAAVVVEATGASLTGPWLLLVMASPWLSMAGWPLYVTRRRGNGPVLDLGLSFRRGTIGPGVAGGVVALTTGIVIGVLTTMLVGDFGSAAGDSAEDLAAENGWPVLALFALMVCIAAPIAEELTFRGLLFSGLAKRGAAPWVCVVVSAAAFSLLHFEPVRLPLLFGVGLVLGVVRLRTRSLGPCIVAHGVNNLPGALGILALAQGTMPLS